MASRSSSSSSPSSSFSSESSVSGSSMSALSFSSSHFPATSSLPFALGSSSSPFGTTTASSAFSSIFSTENPASVSKCASSSPKFSNPSKTCITTSSTSGSLSSVSHATISSNLFSSAPSSSSSSDSPFSTALSVQSSASGLTTVGASSSDSAPSQAQSFNSSSSPASNLVVKSTSPPPLFSTVTSASTSAAIASFGTANLFAVSTLSAAKLTAPSPLFSTVTATSALAPSAVASSSLVSSTFGVGSSPSATVSSIVASKTAAWGSVSSFTGSSLSPTTSAPSSISQAQSITTTAPLSNLGFASPFFATWSGFRFQNSSSSFTTPSVSQFSSAYTSAFSLGTSSSSFSFGTSSSAPFQSAFSLKNVAPPTSYIFAAKSTSSLPLFSTIAANASTPTAVASGTAASMISSPAFGASSFAPATTASTNGFSRTTSSFTSFVGGNRSAAFGGFNSFTEFSTKISAPTSTPQTQSTTAPLLCQPSGGSFLPAQTTKKKKRKWKRETPNGEARGVKYCAENAESSPQQEVPSKSSRLSAEASRKTTPQLTPANGNSGKMEYSHAGNLPKGLALQETPSMSLLSCRDLGERSALQHAEVKQSEKENFEGNAISKAFKDCATVMSSLADLDAHMKDLSGYKVKYFALKSEMEAAAIAWKDKEEFLVQVHRNLSDEIKALQFSNQSLKFSNKELAGKCKQKDSQINGLKERIKGMSENLSWKEKQLSLSVKEEKLRGIRRLTQYRTLMIKEIIKKYPEVNEEDLKQVYCPKDDGELMKLTGEASNEPQGTGDVAQDL